MGGIRFFRIIFKLRGEKIMFSKKCKNLLSFISLIGLFISFQVVLTIPTLADPILTDGSKGATCTVDDSCDVCLSCIDGQCAVPDGFLPCDPLDCTNPNNQRCGHDEINIHKCFCIPIPKPVEPTPPCTGCEKLICDPSCTALGCIPGSTVCKCLGCAPPPKNEPAIVPSGTP